MFKSRKYNYLTTHKKPIFYNNTYKKFNLILFLIIICLLTILILTIYIFN